VNSVGDVSGVWVGDGAVGVHWIPFRGAGPSGPVVILTHTKRERKYLPNPKGEQASDGAGLSASPVALVECH
jgi:hypothetical protein